MRGRVSIVLLACLAACSDEAGSAPTSQGTVAVLAPASGAVQIVDVATGESAVLVPDGGPYGSLSLATDGSAVAFSLDSDLVLNRTVFAVDVATSSTREIFPSTGEFMPAFQWLRSGWFSYPFEAGGASRTALAGPGETEARLIGTRSTARIDESPVDDRIVYMDCVGTAMGRCLTDLVVELPDGADRVVLESGLTGTSAPRFSPDGTAVLYIADADGSGRLFSRALVAGPAVDLGATSSTWLLDYESIPGGSRFSPAGTEILVERGSQLLAVAIDGASERVVADQRIAHAAFTASGDIVYELRINTEDPPDDTPEFEYSSFVVTEAGDTVPLLQDDPSCEVGIISATGAYVGYTCSSGPVFRDDGTHVLDTGASYPLGFDRDELGLVVASLSGAQVYYVPLDSSPSRLVADFLWGNGIEWPPFGYVP